MSSKSKAVANSVTVSAKELLEIRQNARSTTESSQRSKKEVLHEMSQQRAAKWGNTIEALRRQKIEDKRKQTEAEEALLRSLDEKEAAIREEKRQMMVARASLAKQAESEEIRKLKSKLLMADIVHQREQQMAIKKHQDSMEKELETKYLAQTLSSMEIFDRKQVEKAEAAKKAQIATQQVIAEQLKGVAARKLTEKKQREETAAQLRAVAAEEKRKERAKEEQRVQRMQQMQREQGQWLSEQIQQKKAQKACEKENDDKMKQYAAEKEHIQNVRKQKEQQRFAERQRTRQRLIDSQTEYLEKMKLDEDDRVAKQVEEAEAKKEGIERAKELQKQQLLRECMEQCDGQRERRTQRKRDELEEDAKRLRDIDLDVKRYREEEQQLTVRRRKDALRVQAFLKQQIIDKKRREITEAERDRAYQQETDEKRKEEQQQISQWAEDKIKEYQAMGLDVEHIFK